MERSRSSQRWQEVTATQRWSPEPESSVRSWTRGAGPCRAKVTEGETQPCWRCHPRQSNREKHPSAPLLLPARPLTGASPALNQVSQDPAAQNLQGWTAPQTHTLPVIRSEAGKRWGRSPEQTSQESVHSHVPKTHSKQHWGKREKSSREAAKEASRRN